MQNISFGTTQNVSLVIEKAGLGKRLIAFLIDYLFLIGIAILASLVIEFTNIEKAQYIWVIISIIFFTYNFFFEIFTDGQSIGKITQKIRVVKSTGEGATIFQYMIRALLRPVDYFAGLGLIVMILNPKGQRLGDITAKTIVIKDNENISFEDTAIVNVEEDYTPMMTRAEVEKLKPKDIELIKKIITETENSKDYSMVGKIHSKIVDITGNTDNRLPFEYINAVVKDYSYYNSGS
jgi:uncharacterized RDD family membrane protein YckC